MIHLSFDQDWAPPWATLDVVERLRRAQLTGTLFVTHPCPSLKEAGEVLELGWHPNFLPGSSHGANVDEVLQTMETLVPDAAGVRAHCLIRGTPYLNAYRERGVRYEASDLHDGQSGLTPFRSWTGLVRIPIWLEDDVLLQRGLPCRLAAQDLESPGLKVVNLHPVLVALNCSDLSQYDDLKSALREQNIPLQDARREDFAPHAQRETNGVGDLLDELITLLTESPARAGGQLRDLAPAA